VPKPYLLSGSACSWRAHSIGNIFGSKQARNTCIGYRISGPIFRQAIFPSSAFCQKLSDFGTSLQDSRELSKTLARRPKLASELDGSIGSRLSRHYSKTRISPQYIKK
jgi:hypothetical protein